MYAEDYRQRALQLEARQQASSGEQLGAPAQYADGRSLPPPTPQLSHAPPPWLADPLKRKRDVADATQVQHYVAISQGWLFGCFILS